MNDRNTKIKMRGVYKENTSIRLQNRQYLIFHSNPRCTELLLILFPLNLNKLVYKYSF